MRNGAEALSSTAKIASLVLWGFIGVTAVVTLLQLVVIVGLDVLGPAAILFGVVNAGLSVLQILLFLVSIVVVALWIHQAHENLHSAGLVGLNYSPAWATASFFIPLVNFYVPFASTRELYNRSHGESDWHAAAAAGPVTSWYACNWGALAIFIAASGYLLVDAIPGVFVLLPMWAFLLLIALLYLLVLGSAWFLLQVVQRVTDAQAAGYHVSQGDVFD